MSESTGLPTLRRELALIGDWVTPGARVLDLGCGDGALLAWLARQRGVTGYGLEIDPENAIQAIGHGVDVIQADLNAGLAGFRDDSFDFVIMTQTLQAMDRPDRVLDEMLRVGRQGIVTLPNFAHWRSRVQLALGGHMPVSPALPAQWYETRNIHLCSLRDFESLCRERHIRILERSVVSHRHQGTLGARLLPNLLGEVALYRFTDRQH